MKIRYKSRHGLPECEIYQFVGQENQDLKTWQDGQVRDIPDSRMVKFRRMIDMRATVVDCSAVDAVLDCGPDFVDDATGLNPDYVCAVTGKEALDQGFLNLAGEFIAYRNDEGKPLTIDAFLVQHPEYIQQHVAAGMSADRVSEVRAKIDELANKTAAPAKSSPAPVAPQAPAQANPDEQGKG